MDSEVKKASGKEEGIDMKPRMPTYGSRHTTNDGIGAAEGNEGPTDLEARREYNWLGTVCKTRRLQTLTSATLQKPRWGLRMKIHQRSIKG